jgi:UDP-glucose:(heptosyl)LPS alpha-1,3-glucosyltransferase
MNRIRIATGILNLSKTKGGAERSLADLCTSLAKEGHEVHVYAEQWDEEDPRISFHRVKTIPFPKSLRFLSFAIRATREIEKEHYDLSLGVGNTLKADVLQPRGGVHWAWFWRSLRAYDHPISWTIKFLGRILSPKQWVNGWIEDAPYRERKLPKIIAISDMVKQDMVHWYKIPEDRIAVEYTRVDMERFHPRNHQYREEIRRKHGIGDECVILFVSNNYRMKGLGHLIRALAKNKREGCPPFRLLVLGRDRKGPYLRLSKKLGVSEEVVFAGSTGEPEKYFGAADLLVHPTFYDACSRTVLEAMASGLPVITTTSNGAGGMLTDGEEGFVIEDPRRIETLSERIGFFWDEEKRKEASLRSRRRLEHYALDKDNKTLKEMIRRSVPK